MNTLWLSVAGGLLVVLRSEVCVHVSYLFSQTLLNTTFFVSLNSSLTEQVSFCHCATTVQLNAITFCCHQNRLQAQHPRALLKIKMTTELSCCVLSNARCLLLQRKKNTYSVLSHSDCVFLRHIWELFRVLTDKMFWKRNFQ